VLVLDSVGVGLTGPMPRREAAKSGSRPSRSIAVVWTVIVNFVVALISSLGMRGGIIEMIKGGCHCSPT
jgi:hypothetical protein